MLGLTTRLSSADMDVTFDHIAPGYGKLSSECVEAISLLARTEGVLVDPTYTGKAMAALVHDARQDRFPDEKRIVFVHTGGAPALFAYSEEFGRLLQARVPAGSAGL
jgi:1-aminocyclopropane-1-carboxylate deaminase/D-cysteine desulfhydrase-like pyridoxal-dependent ACC family enzyme